MLSAKPWNLDRVVLALAGILFCACIIFLAGAVALHFVSHGKPDKDSLLNLVVVTMAIHGSILVGTGLVLWWYHVGWGEAFGFSMLNWKSVVVLGLLAAVAFLPVGLSLQFVSARIMTQLQLKTREQAAVETLENAESLETRVYLIVFTILVAPVAEEILFRGILYPAIKQAGYPRTAMWATALVWAVIHMTAAIVLPLFVLGLALAYLYEKTNNLLAPITAHAVFNAINVAFLYFGDDLSQAIDHWLHHS
jgi:membrane protease YdiL (CAAX protease family)